MSGYILFTKVQGMKRPIKKHPQQFGHSGTTKNFAFHQSSASVWGLPWLRWLVSSLSSQMPRVNPTRVGFVLDKLAPEQVYL